MSSLNGIKVGHISYEKFTFQRLILFLILGGMFLISQAVPKHVEEEFKLEV